MVREQAFSKDILVTAGLAGAYWCATLGRGVYVGDVLAYEVRTTQPDPQYWSELAVEVLMSSNEQAGIVVQLRRICLNGMPDDWPTVSAAVTGKRLPADLRGGYFPHSAALCFPVTMETNSVVRITGVYRAL